MRKGTVSLQIITMVLMVSAIPSWTMQAPTQSLSQYNYKAASVLPATYFKGSKYVILGRESGGSDQGTYDDFGGKRDANENHPITTATREFFEEGILQETLSMDLVRLKDKIDLSSPTNTTQVIVVNQNAVTYIVDFASADIVSFRKKFHDAFARQWSHKYKEKDRIATVRWDRLESAIRGSKSNTGVQVQARLIDSKTGQEENQRSSIMLRPFFVKKLRPYIENSSYQAGKSSKIHFY
jgi:hypothetical protein